MTIIIGVDPGKSGAIAVLDDGALRDVGDMPVVGATISAARLSDMCSRWLPLDYVLAVVEDVHAMPKQGVSSTFAFGRSLGVIEGALGALSIPTHYVSPARWKRDLRLGKDKGESRRRAIELWPDRADWFARVKDDGRAEAALIAYWWLHHGDGRVAA
jgi:hypothetical protein